MFHKIKNVSALPEYKLSVQFSEGVTKIYDVKPLFDKIPVFAGLKDNLQEFFNVSVDIGGYGIVWNDDIDLSCDELWENGVQADTPFDGLMAFLRKEKAANKLMWGNANKMQRHELCYIVALDRVTKEIVAVLDNGEDERMNFMNKKKEHAQNYRGTHSCVFVQEY